MKVSHALDDNLRGLDGVPVADVNERMKYAVADTQAQLRELTGDKVLEIVVVEILQQVIEVILGDVEPGVNLKSFYGTSNKKPEQFKQEN